MYLNIIFFSSILFCRNRRCPNNLSISPACTHSHCVLLSSFPLLLYPRRVTTWHVTRDTWPLTGPCVVPGAEDAVVTRVKGYIDAGTCGSVSFTAYSAAECGDNAASYYKEFEYGGKRVQVTNNVSNKYFPLKWNIFCHCYQIPDHAAEHDQLQSNPNKRCPGWQFISLPLNPAKVRD